MKYLIILLIIGFSFAKEIDLYSKNGKAVAYIDLKDEFNIYLWDGTPVAYIDDHSIYGFNGKHLGWFKNGLVWDNYGYVVGYQEGVFTPTYITPIKAIKHIAPIKAIKHIAPIEPIFIEQWSMDSLDFFLYRGR